MTRLRGGYIYCGFRFTPETRAQLDALAAATGQTMTAMLAQLIAEEHERLPARLRVPRGTQNTNAAAQATASVREEVAVLEI